MHYEVERKVTAQNACREDILRGLPGWLAGFPEGSCIRLGRESEPGNEGLIDGQQSVSLFIQQA